MIEIRTTLFLLFILLVNVLKGQNDTLFSSYLNTENNNNIKIIATGSGYIILNYNYNYFEIDNFYSIFLTDFDGNIIKSLDTLRINNINLESIQSFDDHEDGILLLANAVIGFSQDAFISIRIDNNLDQIEVLDTFNLNEGEDLIFMNKFKHNSILDLFEGFGLVVNQITNEDVSNVYIGITSSGKISKSQTLNILGHPTFVMDFSWIPDNLSYFLTFWNRTSMSLDMDFNILKTMDNLFLYKIADTTFHAVYTFYDCHYNGGKLVCAGTGGSNNMYNYSLSDINLEGDSFFIKSLISLLPPGTSDDIILGNLIVDNSGDYISAGTGYLNPFNVSVDSNKLYFSKISKDLNLVWQTTFYNAKELAIADITSDENNDIAIIGGHWASEFPDRAQGFFLKIFHNGSLTSVGDQSPKDKNLIKLYPSPAHDYIIVELKSNEKFEGKIISYNGNICVTFLLRNGYVKIDIAHLPPGAYQIQLHSAKTNNNQTSLFIKS